MKQLLLLFMICFSVLVIVTRCGKHTDAVTRARTEVVNEISGFKQLLNDSMLPLAKGTSTKDLQRIFSETRFRYKKMEWAVEYFMPTTARFVNGPALDELELEENKAVPPEGLQVIEELIYPEYDTANREELVRNIKIMLGTSERMKQHFEAISFSKEQVTDAIRLQLYRIITLGIAGFDAPIAQGSITEAAVSLEHLAQVTEMVLQPVSDSSKQLLKRITGQMQTAAAFCRSNNNFNSFNRAAFITDYINPLCGLLYQFQQTENIAFINDGRYYRSNAATLFDSLGFDVNSFIPSAEYAYTAAKKILGEKLFYDNILSNGNNRNCGSCHQPQLAFSDGLTTSASLRGGFIKRNAPSISYAALQHGQFWDMRRSDLESQTTDVIENKDEMHGSLTEAVRKLEKEDAYTSAFKEAFPNAAKIEPWQVQNALASYIRSLAVFNSRFDAYMRGNKQSMNSTEIQGFNLFIGKAKCGTCHFVPVFNGTVPPSFQKTESEVLGTPADAAGTKPDTDEGRFVMHPLPQLLRSFKTPGIRNAAVTAPYMHNGVYKTMEELMNFYNKGGGKGLGLQIENQTLPPDALQLTTEEVKAVIAFMQALTDNPKAVTGK
jgi:cytochrome c peroxidase